MFTRLLQLTVVATINRPTLLPGPTLSPVLFAVLFLLNIFAVLDLLVSDEISGSGGEAGLTFGAPDNF